MQLENTMVVQNQSLAVRDHQFREQQRQVVQSSTEHLQFNLGPIAFSYLKEDRLEDSQALSESRIQEMEQVEQKIMKLSVYDNRGRKLTLNYNPDQITGQHISLLA
ncbi:MAG: hypothetical protein HRT89_10725 [Lentisphaeria bacterium]|nr:hypothetical protein [Lentisphaeria bacterium]NQZ68530.1 hypothetical protein [Lentisphaeria bacterium]